MGHDIVSSMDIMNQPRKVVVVGGSLSGLMCAIALKHSGCNVTVVEREGDLRESHMAGVGLGQDILTFLGRHDRVSSPFTLPVLCMQSVQRDLSVRAFFHARRDMASWDAYYYRLRSIFDGLVSTYYPSPPASSETDGAVLFNSGKEVLDISRNGGGADSGLTLEVLDRKTHETIKVQADLIIGADGPDSFVRSKYLPKYGRKTVGYVIWRGVVPERDVSQETLKLFEHSSNVHLMHRQHCISYLIPGDNGSIEPGERQFNFAWYTNETPESLDELLVDAVDGHRHRVTVPSGHIRPHVWKARVENAKRLPFPEPFLEIVTKIQTPFVQVITESDAQGAAFEDGKVLLMGDALCQFRPHTAFSANQAAFDSLLVSDYVNGSIRLAEWEEKVVRFANLHSSQSRFYGKYYQDGMMPALLSASWYWWYCGIDRLKSWWRGETPLLRTSTVLDDHKKRRAASSPYSILGNPISILILLIRRTWNPN